MPLFKARRSAESGDRLKMMPKLGAGRRCGNRVWCRLMRRCNVAPCTSAATFWHTPERLYEEISADYSDIVYARRTREIEACRKSFIRKWPLKCRIAESLEEAGNRWFTLSLSCQTAVAHEV